MCNSPVTGGTGRSTSGSGVVQLNLELEHRQSQSHSSPSLIPPACPAVASVARRRKAAKGQVTVTPVTPQLLAPPGWAIKRVRLGLAMRHDGAAVGRCPTRSVYFGERYSCRTWASLSARSKIMTSSSMPLMCVSCHGRLTEHFPTMRSTPGGSAISARGARLITPFSLCERASNRRSARSAGPTNPFRIRSSEQIPRPGPVI